MRAAAVQLNSNEDKERNLASANELTRAAAADGAQLVVLPEKFNVLGTHEDYVKGAETLDGPTISWARETAAEFGIDLVAGSIVERRDGHEKFSNTCVHISPDGDIRAVYRKIHMFDVVVGDIEYKESASEEAGEEIVRSELGDGEPVGLTVCYDLRFPELFRILAIKGATVITLPAAFTKITGEAHWEILIRARAIENQVFMVAAGQVGTHPENKESYGNSMIVDPWGEVLARVTDNDPGYCVAELDFERQAQVREKLPSLANRQAAAYVWPQEAAVR
ncbi:MAG TPA: carbon-nitrogen hydrolase family protein [Thermoleophilaceae bacterium]|jgi:predicted amidohydrolase|nr:carbon-nitrogen hydrolase family protein [Thermoleophilaceae bacterium]